MRLKKLIHEGIGIRKLSSCKYKIGTLKFTRNLIFGNMEINESADPDHNFWENVKRQKMDKNIVKKHQYICVSLVGQWAEAFDLETLALAVLRFEN